jgi:hypothetical protein
MGLKGKVMVIGKDSSDGLRLARVYWIGLGRPQRLNSKGVMDNWAPRMETLMRKAGMGYEDFKWYLIWSTRLRDEDGANYGNDFTAQYLRNAHDPMNILEKHFTEVFFNIFMETASKKIPLLKDKVQREQEMLHKNDPPPSATYLDIIPEHPVWSEAWRREYARWLNAVDKRFPMLEPAPGEDIEDFVDRMFLPFSDNREWRCSKCRYNPSSTGVRNSQETEDSIVEQVVWHGREERLVWCGDCYEELMADLWEDKIVHAQDNDPVASAFFDLLLTWKP